MTNGFRANHFSKCLRDVEQDSILDDFYNSKAAEKMATELQCSSPLLLEGHKLIKNLIMLYAGYPQQFKKETQESEIRLCIILLKLWKTYPEERKMLSALIISCGQRLERLQ